MIVTVSVTAEDIARGKPGQACDCPVWHAIARALPWLPQSDDDSEPVPDPSEAIHENAGRTCPGQAGDSEDSPAPVNAGLTCPQSPSLDGDRSGTPVRGAAIPTGPCEACGELMAIVEPERLAIISEVGIGYRDIDSPVLWFTTHVSESSAALQVLSWDEAYEVLKGVREVRDLNGLACWVSCEGNRIKFLRMWSR